MHEEKGTPSSQELCQELQPTQNTAINCCKIRKKTEK